MVGRRSRRSVAGLPERIFVGAAATRLGSTAARSGEIPSGVIYTRTSTNIRGRFWASISSTCQGYMDIAGCRRSWECSAHYEQTEQNCGCRRESRAYSGLPRRIPDSRMSFGDLLQHLALACSQPVGCHGPLQSWTVFAGDRASTPTRGLIYAPSCSVELIARHSSAGAAFFTANPAAPASNYCRSTGVLQQLNVNADDIVNA